MSFPPIHNTRSPQQWEIISKHVDFKDKTVLDLGCGYGDILARCYEAEARCCGVEKDYIIFQHIDNIFGTAATLLHQNIEKWIHNENRIYDIIICFSVLPYLKQPFTILEWIREHSQIALIEMQYFSDGPGPELIKDDNDMHAWLSQIGWQSIEPIGKTFVESRDKYRTIWMCQ